MPVMPLSAKTERKTPPGTRSDTLFRKVQHALDVPAAALQPITLYYEADHINVLVRQRTIWPELRHGQRVF